LKRFNRPIVLISRPSCNSILFSIARQATRALFSGTVAPLATSAKTDNDIRRATV